MPPPAAGPSGAPATALAERRAQDRRGRDRRANKLTTTRVRHETLLSVSGVLGLVYHNCRVNATWKADRKDRKIVPAPRPVPSALQNRLEVDGNPPRLDPHAVVQPRPNPGDLPSTILPGVARRDEQLPKGIRGNFQARGE